jgi:hypothetical protein
VCVVAQRLGFITFPILLQRACGSPSSFHLSSRRVKRSAGDRPTFRFFSGGTLKRTISWLALALFAASTGLLAQDAQTASNDTPPASPADSQYTFRSASPHEWTPPDYSPTPFSRLAFGAGMSALGINMQVAANLNRYMNVRGVGNFFNYSLNNVSVNGLNASGSVNFATAGASLDFYPFPRLGFRVSPGVLFYNQNQVSATVTAPAGASFTLNGYTYNPAQASPVTGTGTVGLHTQSPAFTISTGWGNMISRRGHFSFPVEIGAAFIGSPAVNVALSSGQVCQNTQGTVGCQNVATDAQLQSNLQAQIAKYQSDLNPFRIYPIFSSGIAYSFSLRGGGASQVARPQ